MELRELPTFYCPFPSAIHPRAEEARVATLAWVRDFRLAESAVAWHRLDATRPEILAARGYPDTTFEQLVLATKWMIWFFQFDDQLDEGSLGHQPEGFSQVYHALLALLAVNGPTVPVALPKRQEDVLAAALCDVWQSTCAVTSAAWQARYIEFMANYFSAYCQEIENRARGIIPDIESYIGTRNHSGAMHLSFSLHEAFSGSTFSSAVLASVPFQTLWSSAVDAICWANDILSLEKELARDEVNNLVVVLRNTYHCSWQKAIEMVNERCTAQVLRFLDAERQLFTHFPGLLSEEATVHYCVDGIRDWIRGNLDWSLIAYRYNVIEEAIPDQPVSYLETLLSTQGGASH